MRKHALVLGAGGFIGGAMVKRLKSEGYWVRAVDQKYHEYFDINEVADEFIRGDLRNPAFVEQVMTSPAQTLMFNLDDGYDSTLGFDEVYQFAADMGGAGFVFTGENDADIMHNSAMINLNVADSAVKRRAKKIFYSSSACMYPEHNQSDPENPNCIESSAYPAHPDSEYGWEKLFSERLWMAFARNHDIDVRIARYHNIFGPEGTWDGGREKAPAAFCRKAAMARDGETIEVWGPGSQTRSFLYIDECIEATLRLMRSDFTGPVNIGSEEMISINDLAKIAIELSKKQTSIYNIQGKEFIDKYGHKCPIGVNGRNSDNTLYEKNVGWKVSQPLYKGMEKTYEWILKQVNNKGEN